MRAGALVPVAPGPGPGPGRARVMAPGRAAAGGGSLDGGGGGGGSLEDGGAGGWVVVVTMISSCIGGVDVVGVLGVASLLVSDRANKSDTDTTSAMAATIAATPTIHGQRAVFSSWSSTTASS